MKQWPAVLMVVLVVAVLATFLGIVVFARSDTQRVPGGLIYSHDAAHHVSCWQGVYSISCLPDSEVTLP